MHSGKQRLLTSPRCISLSRSRAGPPDVCMGGSPHAGMQQAADAREDGDEAQPAGDHGSAPNTT